MLRAIDDARLSLFGTGFPSAVVVGTKKHFISLLSASQLTTCSRLSSLLMLLLLLLLELV